MTMNIVSKFAECVRVLVGGCGRGDCLDTERPNGAHPQVRDSPRDQEATLGHTLIQVVAEIPHTEQKNIKGTSSNMGFQQNTIFPSLSAQLQLSLPLVQRLLPLPLAHLLPCQAQDLLLGHQLWLIPPVQNLASRQKE